MPLDQGKAGVENGPSNLDPQVMQSTNNNTISAQTWYDVMQRAVTKCPEINLGCKGYQIPSCLDPGTDVTLIWQSYFDENLMHLVKAHSDEKSEAHTLFHFMVANDEQLPITKYFELDLNFIGLIVPRVGILVTRDPNQLLDPEYQTRLPEAVGWNQVHLAFKEFIELYRTAVFNSFDCPSGVNPLLFPQICIYYYTDVCTIQTSAMHTALRNTYGHDQPSNNKTQNFFWQQGGLDGHGNFRQQTRTTMHPWKVNHHSSRCDKNPTWCHLLS